MKDRVDKEIELDEDTRRISVGLPGGGKMTIWRTGSEDEKMVNITFWADGDYPINPTSLTVHLKDMTEFCHSFDKAGTSAFRCDFSKPW